MSFFAIKMAPADNVATVLQSVAAGNDVAVRSGNETQITAVSNDIPSGHKFALTDIDHGQQIKKYGQVIGLATSKIQKGQHVHVHNVESCRGRGDK